MKIWIRFLKKLAFVLILFASAGVAAKEPVVDSRYKLDVPLTRKNSYYQDFGYGVILRLPKILYQLDYDAIDQPISAQAISMTFIFPDMVLGGAPSQMDTIFEKQSGNYKSRKDRFPVRIPFMFYSPGDVGLAPIKSLIAPRPPRIDLNAFGIETGPDAMVRIPTPVAGLEAKISLKWLKSHPEHGTSDPKSGARYVAKKDSPYELYMDCDSFDGVQCRANVYSKKHKFQYNMFFPPEAVEHTDEIIKAIDKLLDQWRESK